MSENKKLAVAEIEPKIDATTCPDRLDHRQHLGQVCNGCGELIPGGNMYTPEQMARYFPGGQIIATPKPPLPYTDEIADLWRQYEVANQAYTDAVFAIEDLHRGRRNLKGTDDAASARGARFEVEVASAEERRDKLREASELILREIGRLDQLRKSRAMAAMFAESYPPPAPTTGLGQRIAAAIRGERA